jgi:hypothetical protein
MQNRMFYLEADEITQREFELIHIYIRKKLQSHNEHVIIRSVPLEKFNVIERLINSMLPEY